MKTTDYDGQTIYEDDPEPTSRTQTPDAMHRREMERRASIRAHQALIARKAHFSRPRNLRTNA